MTRKHGKYNTINQDAIDIAVSRDGIVGVRLQGDNASIQEIGLLELARFPNAAGLDSRGGNLYLETPNSGAPILARPGEEGLGETASGYLEKSNVEAVNELVAMISAQRAYELNSKTISMADEMLQTVNRLKR